MKSWLILVWLAIFAGQDWLNGAEGDKQCPASRIPPQAAGHDSTGGEEANNGTRQEHVTCQEGPQQTGKGPQQTKEGPEQTGKGPEQTEEGPEQTGKGPEQTGKGPEQTEEGPEQTRKGPEQTEEGPQQTEEGPQQTSGKRVEDGREVEGQETQQGLVQEGPGGEESTGCKPASSVPEGEGEADRATGMHGQGHISENQSTMELDKKLDKELSKKPAKGLDKESAKEPDKELEKESAEEPTKEPTAAPTTEATMAPTTTPQRCPPSDPWGSCGDDAKEESPRVATALTDFALKFYSKLAKGKGTSSNVVFSPFSVALALSHLLLGARGETKGRLESILSYPSDLVCVHAPLQRLLKSQALISASALFLRQGLHLNEAFRNQSLHFYNSRPQMLSGNETQDLQLINKWVRVMTKGKIKKLLKELEPDVQLVLLNAVYFQSKWKTTFKVKNTVNETFYRPGQASIQVPMMTSKKYPLAFFNDPNLQAKVGRLQLSHNVSLIVIVPQLVSQMLAEVQQKLTKETFAAVMKKLMGTPFKPTVVSLPKLKLDSSQNLLDILGEMDYGIFYDSNLCGISEAEDLLVTSAQHRAMLELNEEGVEAAAATAFSVARTAWVFDVQQPFLFVLWNDDHSFPIFMGHVNDPRV
ncbi:plasma protease C1 inhibitor isoform X3 [Trachemys scripta elegans]|uniref:plasma protease C1 inhibitor isoform X3 n=1 Tax=Trachemys scripta elegans TaxID=31138 RepID=UPI001554D7A8|nr:plasma protease C1 inhibitor isoform X3 [Trachemys scripta elegans]